MRNAKMTIWMRIILFIVTLLGSGSVSGEVTVHEGVTVEVYAENVPMPLGLAFDSWEYLYVGHDEVSPGRIYKISPGGVSVSLFGPMIEDPDSVAVDSSDYIFVGSEEGLYRVDPNGTSTLFTSTYMGNNTCIVIDDMGLFGQVGDIYVSNARSYYDIVRVKSDGRAYEFVSDSILYVPFGLAFDDVGYLFAAESAGGVRGIYRITISGELNYFVGLNTPYSMAFNKIERQLYVGDIGDNRIYKVSLEGRVCVFAEDIKPFGLTFGPDGSLYVSDRSISPHRILKISGFGPQSLDDDCDVNFVDFAIFALSWLTQPGDPQWNPVCDISIPPDNFIGMQDFAILVDNWMAGLQ